MENPDYFSQPSSYRINYNMRTFNNDPLLPPSPSSSSASLPRPLTESTLSDNSYTKKELIQQATTRLRCKTLLYGLGQVKSRVAELQSELDNLRIEVDTTENVLSKFGDHPNDRQLQALEKRFSTHQQHLDHVLSPNQQQQQLSSSATRPPTPPDSNPTMTFSSTLLRVSSIFGQNKSTTPTKSNSTTSMKSNRSTTSTIPMTSDPTTLNYPQQQQLSTSTSTSTCSYSDYNSDTATPSIKEARDRRKQRRERVKQIKQKYQASVVTCDQNWNTKENWINPPQQQPQPQQSSSSSSSSSSPSPLPPPSSPSPSPSPLVSTNLDDVKDTPVKSKQIPSEQPPKPCKGKGPKLKNITPDTNTTTTIDKRRTATATTATAATATAATTTTTAGSRKTMTTPTAPKPAQCLCKRKTNKPDPIKHHKAASSTSRTYYSKHPEMASLETTPCPVETNVVPEPLQDHNATATTNANATTTTTTATMTTPIATVTTPDTMTIPTATVPDQDEPPLPSNVTEWLEQQQEYQPIDYDTPIKQQQQQPSDAYRQVMEYIDNFTDFENDIELHQDITHLLSPLKSTYSGSTTASSSSSCDDGDNDWDVPRHSFYHQRRLYSLLVNHGMTRLSRYLLEGMRKGLSWCKFLSVLAVALLISLGRGPDHMLLSLDDMYYLECLTEEDGFVDSYFL